MDGLAKQKSEHVAWAGNGISLLTVPKPVLLNNHAALFQRAPIFQGLTTTECLEVASVAQTCVYRKGDPIFRYGDPMRTVLLLEIGRVKITQLSRDGKEVILRVDNPGDLLTSPGKSPTGIYSHNAFALETCQVIVWKRAVFEVFEERFPRICRNSVSILSERLRNLETTFFELATELVTQRLARVLLRLSRHQSMGDNSEARVDFTNEQLAQMIGTTLFTVCRMFSDWEEQGIVRTQRKSVIILNVPALRILAEMTPD